MAIENSVSTYFDLLSSIVLTFLIVACPLLNRGPVVIVYITTSVNGISLAIQLWLIIECWPILECWRIIECWLGNFVIFQGIRTGIAKKPIFVIFQGMDPLPPLDPGMYRPVTMYISTAIG